MDMLIARLMQREGSEKVKKQPSQLSFIYTSTLTIYKNSTDLDVSSSLYPHQALTSGPLHRVRTGMVLEIGEGEVMEGQIA